MKKIVLLAIALGMVVSSCLPAPATNVPAASVDLDATAAVFVQQTLDALPSITLAPTNTSVVAAETTTPSLTETSTVQAEAITGTSTATGTLSTSTAADTATTQTPVSFTTTASFTFTPNGSASATQTLHPRFYGTLPPNLPYSGIELVNKSKAEAYISLQATTKDGYTTILEYPVGNLFAIQAPVGKYKYVAWVGGNKIIGSFALGNGSDLRITIYKDRVEIKQR